MNVNHGAAGAIRSRRPEDLEAAAAALVTVHASDGYPVEGVADSLGWLSPAGLLKAWVAEVEGAIVGHAAIDSPPSDEAVSLWEKQHPEDKGSVVTLARVFVVPRARKHALGEALVRAAEDHARARGLRLVLDVMAKDTAAIRLYERLGWRRFAETTHSFGEGGLTPAACYVASALD